jgi:hypothetical protein
LRREIAEEKLRIMNDMLDERVAERTAKLSSANEHLKSEILDRTAAEKQLLRSAEFINQILVAAPCVLAIYDVNTMECSYSKREGRFRRTYRAGIKRELKNTNRPSTSTRRWNGQTEISDFGFRNCRPTPLLMLEDKRRRRDRWIAWGVSPRLPV